MSWTTGHTGGDVAVAFDGSAGAAIPAAAELPGGATPRHISAWLQYDGLGDAVILDCGIDGDRTRFLFLAGGDASLAVVFGGGQTVNSGPGFLNDGLWHLLEVAYDGTTVDLFIDSVNVASAAWTLATDTSGASIGQLTDGSDPYPFNLQDWQVWPTAGP